MYIYLSTYVCIHEYILRLSGNGCINLSWNVFWYLEKLGDLQKCWKSSSSKSVVMSMIAFQHCIPLACFYLSFLFIIFAFVSKVHCSLHGKDKGGRASLLLPPTRHLGIWNPSIQIAWQVQFVSTVWGEVLGLAVTEQRWILMQVKLCWKACGRTVNQPESTSVATKIKYLKLLVFEF